MWGLLTKVKWMMHGVGMGVRVGRVRRRMRVMVGGMTQRWMVVPFSPVTSASGRGSFCSLGRSSLCQTRLVGPVGLGDDDVGVLEESSGTEAVVVHRLGVGLQVALHVLWVKREV